MKKMMMLTIFLCLPVFAEGVVDPDVLIGADDYEHQMCVDRETNRCVETICLTSDERDCQEQCKRGAEDKCRMEQVQ